MCYKLKFNHVVIIPNHVIPEPQRADLSVGEMASWTKDYNNADYGEQGKSGHGSTYPGQLTSST